jgi:arylformamidase
MMGRLAVGAAASSIALSSIAVAQRPDAGVSRECRREVIKLCGFRGGREGVRTCLTQKYQTLSENCREEILSAVAKRTGEASALPAGAQAMSYGSDPAQVLDFWPASKSPKADKSPLIVFVHGGGWKRGSKDNATGRLKPEHYPAQGYAFASINYRLVPAATVEQQAADVAAALKSLIARADVDSRQVVLMGHSAGAHLVALVGTDERYLMGAGLSFANISGVIPIDGAAYDVIAQMVDGPQIMQSTYGQAFGTDPARQKALSPTFQASAPNAPQFLLLYVQRPDGIRQANSLGAALKMGGSAVEVGSFPGEGLQGHAEINQRLGDPDYAPTALVDRWLKKIFAR